MWAPAFVILRQRRIPNLVPAVDFLPRAAYYVRTSLTETRKHGCRAPGLFRYHAGAEEGAFPITFRFTALRKDGSTFSAETDMIPIAYDGHAIAYHFVRQLGE